MNTLTKIIFSSLGIILLSFSAHSQATFSERDSLRGFLSPLRSNYDVYHYDLQVEILPDQKKIRGHNTISFLALKDLKRLQIDLSEKLALDSILFQGEKLKFERKFDAVFITLPEQVAQNNRAKLKVYYSGIPKASERPPWSGGFVWSKDTLERNWIAVSCQGLGASSWWPCKDHVADEPDSMRIRGVVPQDLMLVANGNLVRTQIQGDKKLFEWKVTYPINNYNVSVNIGHYQNFKEAYYSPTKDADLELDYYVLDYNLAQAQTHFKQVKTMLSVYEELFGEYPFWNDGFALVEVDYWGMEHQSAVAYGNKYNNNDFDFDFIIIHEAGHEYFGNSISALDQAELWIHESFTTYLEALYVEKTQNLDSAIAYLNTQKPKIKNEHPIIGPLHVAARHKDTDMYYKGTWFLHTLRNILADDTKWFKILKSYYQKYKYQNIHSEDVFEFFSQAMGLNLKPVFEQYLTKTDLPTLAYQVKPKGRKFKLLYRWEKTAEDFAMPIDLMIGQDEQRVYPTSRWQKMKISQNTVALDTNQFYVRIYEKKE